MVRLKRTAAVWLLVAGGALAARQWALFGWCLLLPGLAIILLALYRLCLRTLDTYEAWAVWHYQRRAAGRAVRGRRVDPATYTPDPDAFTAMMRAGCAGDLEDHHD